MKITFRKPKFNLQGIWNIFIQIGSNSLSQLLVFFLVLIGLNIISQEFFARIDLTQNKIYSLSDGTLNIINSFDGEVAIDVFFSENLPPDIIPISQDVKDVFEEYERFSNGKVKINIRNPRDESFETEATDYGIPEVQFSEFSQDKFEIATGFVGISISYNDENEIIPIITNVDNLEYETSSRIYKLTHPEKISVGFLTGHGEKSILSEYRTISDLLGRQFSVQNIDLKNGEPVDPEKIKVLVIASPTSDFSERDLFEIDQYIMRGGRVIILAENYQTDLQNLQASLNQTNLLDFLSYYGIRIPDQMVLDESYIPLIYGMQRIPYPYWVLIQRENINTENPALNMLESSSFFWSSPLEIIEQDGTLNFTPLMKTTEKAWTKDGQAVSIDVEDAYSLSENQFTLSYLIEGSHVSMFKDKEIPVIVSEDEEPVEDKRTPETNRADQTDDIKIIVFGDSDFISDNFNSSSNENTTMFLNIVEWLASTDELASIRSKNVTTRPLEIIEEGQKALVKSINIALVPVLTIIFGTVYNYIRKKSHSRF
jgi:gliding-associated putative ABC transporter substrate-binding component GldG